MPARVLCRTRSILRVRMEERGSGDTGAGRLARSQLERPILAARLRFCIAVARRREEPSGAAVRPH